jgi:hypothetical protein
MKKRYRVATGVRLDFADGQVVEDGAEFERDYDPVQEAQHLHGGHVVVVESEPVKPKRSHHAVVVKEDSDG